jgi:hypothetical protein
MMNCKAIQEKIDIEFRHGVSEISGDLKAHIENCPVCSSYLRELTGLDNILNRSHFEVRPGELDDLTFEKIVSIASGKKRIRETSGRIFRLKWALIPAAAAAVIIIAMFIPRMTNTPTVATSNSIDYYLPIDENLEETLASSDTLTNQFLLSMAGSSGDLDIVADELLSESDINDILSSLSASEMEALYQKLGNLKG